MSSGEEKSNRLLYRGIGIGIVVVCIILAVVGVVWKDEIFSDTKSDEFLVYVIGGVVAMMAVIGLVVWGAKKNNSSETETSGSETFEPIESIESSVTGGSEFLGSSPYTSGGDDEE